MRTKFYILITTTVSFYFFIIFHRVIFQIYGDDFMLHVLFYMSLFFSAILVVEVYRNRFKDLKWLSLMDLLLRIFVLVLHFVYLLMEINLAMVNVLTIAFLLSDIIIQLIIYRKVKELHSYKIEVKKVTSENLSEVILYQ